MRKFLCVEDDETQRMVLDPLLASAEPDSERHWAENARQAIEHLRRAAHERSECPYNLMITDIFLDGKITGIDLWNVCRKVYPKMPVLVMSSLPYSKFSEFRAEDPPLKHYLQKPLNPSVSEQLIREALSEGWVT